MMKDTRKYLIALGIAIALFLIYAGTDLRDTKISKSHRGNLTNHISNTFSVDPKVTMSDIFSK